MTRGEVGGRADPVPTQWSPLHIKRDNQKNKSQNIDRNTKDKVKSAPQTPNEAIISIVKCSIGAGSFSLPFAFVNGGIVASVILTLCLGFLSAYTLLLLSASEELALLKKRWESKSQGSRERRVTSPPPPPSSKPCLQYQVLSDSSSSSGRVNCDDDIDISKRKYLQGQEQVLQLQEQQDIETFHFTLDHDNDHSGEVGGGGGRRQDSEGIGNDETKYTWNTTQLNYAEIAKEAFPDYPHTAEAIVSSSIVFTGIGVSAAYLDLISTLIPDILHTFLGVELTSANSVRIVQLIVFVLILLLSFLPNFKSLRFTALIGDISVGCACITVLVYGLVSYKDGITSDLTNSDVVSIIHVSTLPRFFASAFFLFAIHTALLPILGETQTDEEDLKIMRSIHSSSAGSLNDHSTFLPDVKRTKRKIIIHSYFFVTIFNTVFALLACLLYAKLPSKCNPTSYHQEGGDGGGNDNENEVGVCANILSNLYHESHGFNEASSILSIVKLLVCVDLLFTIPLLLGSARPTCEKLILWIFDKKCTQSSTCRNFLSRLPILNNTFTFMQTHRRLNDHDQDGVNCDGNGNNDVIVTTGVEEEEEEEEEKVGEREEEGGGGGEDEGDNEIDELDNEGEVKVDKSNESRSGKRNRNQPKKSKKTTTRHTKSRMKTVLSDAEIYIHYTDIATQTHSEREVETAKFLTRLFLPCVVFTCAVLVPNVADVVTLVGGLVCALSGYTLPPLLYLRLKFQSISNAPILLRSFLMSISLFGVALMIISTANFFGYY